MDKIVTLKNMYDTIGEYLKKYGDKEVLSIATQAGDTDDAYILRIVGIGLKGINESEKLKIKRK